MYLHPILRDAAPALSRLDLDPTPTPVQLAGLAARLADAADRWRPILRHDPDRRWYARLLRTEQVEVWLLAWTPGQEVPGHDHGGAAGAFTVVDGILVEDRLDPGSWVAGQRTSFPAGSRTRFGPDHAHVLGNRGPGPATSVHACSPPGLPLRFAPSARGSGQMTAAVDRLLDQARARLRRLDPPEAAAVVAGYNAWARAGLPVHRPGRGR